MAGGGGGENLILNLVYFCLCFHSAISAAYGNALFSYVYSHLSLKPRFLLSTFKIPFSSSPTRLHSLVLQPSQRHNNKGMCWGPWGMKISQAPAKIPCAAPLQHKAAGMQAAHCSHTTPLQLRGPTDYRGCQRDACQPWDLLRAAQPFSASAPNPLTDSKRRTLRGLL